MDLQPLQQWIGRSERRTDLVSATPLAALSATLDRDDPEPLPGTDVPPLWHWLYFTPLALKSQIGSGSLPVDRLPSAGFAIRPQGKRSGMLNRIEKAMRGLPRPVIGRIEDGALLLDLRCLNASDEAELSRQLAQLIC